jgi:hypothetical protein
MTRIEEVGRRLAEVVVELAGLPSGPSPERFALLREQDALRAEAREWEASADHGRTTESLEAELTELRRSRRALVGTRGGYVMGDGADSAGRIGVALTTMRGRTGSNAEIDRLTVRISRIEDVLAARRATTGPQARTPVRK